eukprot:gnl/TRDRNA2_/TRDRNA2_162205_c1_seq3.p1 gnl/TRDRNA2_/TRDRNA2_162205_c1~~gnl/TRDRNA2_/TRDRNA2_162205_c1_seq3.p1  ORF type:complete len:108 (+),score=11.13 gnl/TRDRNA2_/TRDRNA2_162205_c1_seq3:205-528(+)
MSCRDPSIEELNQMPQWPKYFQAMVNYLELQGFSTAQELLANPFLEKGCEAAHDPYELIPSTNIGFYVCNDTPEMTGVRSFCPVACGCTLGNLPPDQIGDCPPTCLQ